MYKGVTQQKLHKELMHQTKLFLNQPHLTFFQKNFSLILTAYFPNLTFLEYFYRHDVCLLKN